MEWRVTVYIGSDKQRFRVQRFISLVLLAVSVFLLITNAVRWRRLSGIQGRDMSLRGFRHVLFLEALVIAVAPAARLLLGKTTRPVRL